MSSFKTYGQQIVKNAKVLAKELLKYDFNLVSGGTDNHLILIDMKNRRVNGRLAAIALEVAGVVVNMNGVPFDTMPPLYPSGIRLGTPAITTRGMKEKEMIKVAEFINRAVEEVKDTTLPADKKERIEFMKKFRSDVAKNKKLLKIAREVKSLCSKFP